MEEFDLIKTKIALINLSLEKILDNTKRACLKVNEIFAIYDELEKIQKKVNRLERKTY